MSWNAPWIRLVIGIWSLKKICKVWSVTTHNICLLSIRILELFGEMHILNALLIIMA